MINNKKIIGIVPARIGSKGLKFKNLKKLNSKPLIFWPIKTLKRSKYIDKIILNTDSKKIRDLGAKMGAETPFLRPKYLASNKATTKDLIEHICKKVDYHDYFIIIQPTSPLRVSEDIDNALSLCQKENAYSVVSVTENLKHSNLMYYLHDNHQLISL